MNPPQPFADGRECEGTESIAWTALGRVGVPIQGGPRYSLLRGVLGPRSCWSAGIPRCKPTSATCSANHARAETPTLPHSPTAHPSQPDRPTVTEIRREQVHTIKRGHLPRTKKHRSLRMDLRMFSRTIVGGTLLPLLPCDEQNNQRQCACAVRSWRALWPSARFEDCKPKVPRQASSTAGVAPALWALLHPTATSWTSGEAAARRRRALMVPMLLQLLVGEAEHRSACLPCPLLTSARRS